MLTGVPAPLMFTAPLTRLKLMPFVVLFVEVTLVKSKSTGVAGLAAFVILIAGALVVVKLPVLLVTVIEPVLSVPTSPLPFEAVPLKLAKVTLPAFGSPAPAPPRLTSVPADAVLLTVVVPNETDVPAARPLISMPLPGPATPEMLVVPAVTLPPPATCRKATGFAAAIVFCIVKVPNVLVPAELLESETAFVPPVTAEAVPIVVLPKLMSAVDC